jgi:hypothetical protein
LGLPVYIRTVAVALVVACFCVLPAIAFGDAQTGGAGPSDAEFQPTGTARLLPNGTAVAPDDAPPEVKAAIDAGNLIATLPYKYGGGHNTTFEDTGYDCSGSVSYVLHAAGLLDSPLPSGSFMNWGDKGLGRWITLYANGGHMYAVIAGLRFDTSMRTVLARKATRTTKRGKRVRVLSSRWSSTMRPGDGYRVRHPAGF